MIPVYNCAAYLPQTLRSVLQQDPGTHLMQIEVVDDCSTDANIEKLVNEIGRGRVLYYRQPKNAGSLRNFETCLNRATGQRIHLLHGDDKVKAGFYAKIDALFEKFPAAVAAFSNYNFIDHENNFLYTNLQEGLKDGILENFLYIMAERCATQYVGTVVKREVYERTGGFCGVEYGEDWEMWARIAKDHPVAYTPDILAQYRVHTQNISSGRFRTGQNFDDIKKVIERVNSYLPPEKRGIMKRKAYRNYARYALGNSEYIWHVSRDKQTVYKQVKGALNMYTDAGLLGKAAKMYLKIWLHPLRKLVGNVKH
jgi:glycosyltransferase involved in cell wall biosynthesis